MDLGPWTLDLGPWTLDLGPWALGLGPWALGLGPWALGLGPWALGLGPWALGLGALGPWASGLGNSGCVRRAPTLPTFRPSDLPSSRSFGFRAPAPGLGATSPGPKTTKPARDIPGGLHSKGSAPSPPIAGDGACDYAPIPSRISSRDSRSSRYSVR
ncbi:hypothetical protein BOC59_09065 [Burkholderia pseudomallei]|nr:hypothetical protein BOC59_09065 [Burkholderia pseudomallei]